MTFGEKIKEARKEAGLSQEQFAEKMSVSRSAVAKWEADRGMPDVNNMKVMAQLLGVSVDYLLDEDEKLSFNETKESIDLDSYEITGKCRDKRDAACFAKFSDADVIYPLSRNKKMSTAEWLTDFIVAPGIIQGADYLDDMSTYYLVEIGEKQMLVKVTSDFIITSELANTTDVPDEKVKAIDDSVWLRTSNITHTYPKASYFELIDLQQIFIMKSRKANQMLKASRSK